MKKKNNEVVRHVNPDGSLGGYILPGANVCTDSFIAASATVLSGAEVKSGERLESGDVATENGIIRSDEFELVR